MPVVRSYQKKLFDDAVEEGGNKEIGIENTDSVVSSIVEHILDESPELAAEAANCPKPSNTLIAAIIRDIESHKYKYGIFRDELIHKVIEFMSGYGALQKYIEDEDVTDIDGTRYNQFLIKRHGVPGKIPVRFGNAKNFENYCRVVALRNGIVLDKKDGCCRAADEKYRLRIRISISPRNRTGPAISIRKHRRESYVLDELQALGMLDGESANLLEELSTGSASVIFCGKAAAGKTTLLRSFINLLPETERVLILEQEAEIYPDKPYCIERRIRALYGDDSGERNSIAGSVKDPIAGPMQDSVKDAIKEGLRMNIDTCCLGEITGDEAWEFAKAIFDGYRGLAAISAAGAEDVPDKLFSLCKGTAAESDKRIKEILGRSVNFLVQLKDFKVVKVLEITGYDDKRDIFEYRRRYPEK
jgi:pilus assembly protein CpaF